MSLTKTLGRSDTVGYLLAIACAVAVPLVIHDPFILHLLILLGIFAIAGVGLNYVLSMGVFSVCHAAFLGIGAYTSALLVLRAGFSFWIAIIMAGLISSIIGYIIGRITLRVKGLYFAVITFAFGEIVRMLFTHLKSIFGGATGIQDIPPPDTLGLATSVINFEQKELFYLLVLAVMLICLLLSHRLFRSQYSLVFKAIHGKDNLAESLGIDIIQQKIWVFTFGCLLAGISGSLFAHYMSYIGPHSFGFARSVDFFIIVVVGGKGTVLGPVLGSIFFFILPELLRTLKDYQMLFFAGTLILVIFFAPRGLMGTLEHWISLKSSRKGSLSYSEL
jgi:branched-chain amino acid transport system permease protein